MEWTGDVARKGKERNECTVWADNSLGIDHLGNLVVDGKIILKLFLEILQLNRTNNYFSLDVVLYL